MEKGKSRGKDERWGSNPRLHGKVVDPVRFLRTGNPVLTIVSLLGLEHKLINRKSQN